MDLAFIVIAAITLGSAILSISLRNLVHCALALALTFAGLAAVYLKLNAQFVGLAQVLIYIGAIAILIVFAILLTRGTEPTGRSILSSGWIVGLAIAGSLGILLAIYAVSSRAVAQVPAAPAREVTVRTIGEQLMSRYVLPLEVIGLLLTAAMIGAVVLAWREPEKGNE